jgi:RimJ/RimL family protein N-acetyltransferase
MHKMLLDFPTQFESERLYLRCYQPGDGKWFYAMSQKNQEHLMQYEADNVVLTIKNEEAAEVLVRELAADWLARNCFFIGAFDKKTNEFVAQVYVGPVNWNLPEFEIGYFADVDHERQGYVTEAVRATLRVLFEQLNAHRVRLKCDDTNERSIRVAERCHMVREGQFRESKRNPDGTYSGTLVYGLLKSEYKAGW